MDGVIVVVLIVLAILGMPLFAVFGAAAMVLFENMENTKITGAAHDVFSEKFADSPLMVTIPLFVFAHHGRERDAATAGAAVTGVARVATGWSGHGGAGGERLLHDVHRW